VKLKIIKQEKNPFMEREELTIEIITESAPSASEVVAELKKDEALTVVKKINTSFGQQKFIADVFVYENIEAKKKIETIPKKIRKKMATEKKAEEEAAKKAVEAEKKAAEEAAKAEVEKDTEKSPENQGLKTNDQQPK